jgi:type II secretory pathway component PulF
MMLTDLSFEQRAADRRDLITALLFAIDEDRRFDDSLEPFTQTRLGEAGWVTLFALGPLFLFCFRSYWHHEVFGFRIGRVIRDLRNGHDLAHCLRRHLRPWFNKHELAALAEAEAEGRLRETLEILGSKPSPLITRAFDIMLYSLMILGVATFLMIFIAPKYERIFMEMIQERIFLPAVEHLVPFAAALWLLAFIWQRFNLRHRVLSRIPVIGSGWQLEAQAETAGGIAAALAHGVDIGTAIDHTARTCHGRNQRRQLARCAAEIANGEPWLPALRRHSGFDDFSLWMLSCASQSEQLQSGFASVADWCETESRRAHKRYLRWARSLGLALCAAGVLIVALTFFTPLVKLVLGTVDL